MSTERQVIDNFKKICICRSITGGTIAKAIRDGAITFETLRRKIRVGTGQCGAKRCRQKIEDKIRDHQNSLSGNLSSSSGATSADSASLKNN